METKSKGVRKTTAMQKFIKWTKTQKTPGMVSVVIKANALLAEEKKQIKKAFNDSVINQQASSPKYDSAEEYFTQTYKDTVTK